MGKKHIKQQIKDRLSKPFLVWETSPGRKWALFTFVILFSIVFKLIYQPFGFELSSNLTLFIHHAFISSAVLIFQLFFLPKLFAGYFHESKRTLGKQFSWTFILFILLIITHSIYNILFGPHSSIYLTFVTSAWINLGIGIYPVTAIFLLAYIRQLTEARPQNYILTKAIETHPPFLIENIAIQSIGYIKSLDNYSEIHYLDGKKIIRKSLSTLEKELKGHGFSRIHRSYIVNHSYIKSILGNANKSSLILRMFDHIIPISRSKRQSVIKTVNRHQK